MTDKNWEAFRDWWNREIKGDHLSWGMPYIVCEKCGLEYEIGVGSGFSKARRMAARRRGVGNDNA